MSRYPLAVAAALGLAALAVSGPAGIRAAIRDLRDALEGHRLALMLAVIVAALCILMARRYVDVGAEAAYLVASTVAWGALVALFLRYDALAARFARFFGTLRPLTIALAGMALALAAGLLVLQEFPHVSDEVAYQFQAHALAHGRLYFPAPSPADAWTFIHTFVDDGRWYGIMNPGWPLFLAVGYAAHAPWLVNPLLGALAVLAFAGFFREAAFEGRTSRLALALLTLSPFVLFMNGTYMSHPANLLLFGVFCWAWARMLRTRGLGWATLAGLAIALNLLVRPVDTAAVTLPFMIQGLARLWRDRRVLLPAVLAGVLAAGGIAATLAYDRALTGDPMQMPVTKYFEARNPNERFGIGFGDDMGTKMHGDEWPGFHPPDAIRVTAYRLVQFARDVYGLPLLVFALPFLAWQRRGYLFDEWTIVLTAAGLALIGVYFFHFYHGIAYGSRHLYLALPALALLLARLIQGRPRADGSRGAPRVAAAALAALVIHVAVFALPPLVREYGDNYRGSSAIVRREVARQHLDNALILVQPGDWAWKSTFPLNSYPLERSRVLFARDVPATHEALLDAWPGRTVWTLSVTKGAVTLERMK